MLLSVIVPVYNEKENIPTLHDRLCEFFSAKDYNFELIFVDDGSKDNSLDLIRQFHAQDNRVKYLSLARNFGHQIAITSGINFAQGNAVVVMDADLQDPPELIPEMIEKWQQGFQIVYAQRVARKGENFIKISFAFLFYRIIKFLSEIDIPIDTGDFCLMDKKVVDILKTMPERNRYVRGLRAWVGFRKTAVTYNRDPRFKGKPKYTFFKSFLLAIDSIVAFSKTPLRIASFLGLTSAVLSFIMMIIILYWRLVYPAAKISGLTIIIIAMFFLGAIQLFSLGILGEYIGRIYDEVKARPLYTIKEVGGFLETK